MSFNMNKSEIQKIFAILSQPWSPSVALVVILQTNYFIYLKKFLPFRKPDPSWSKGRWRYPLDKSLSTGLRNGFPNTYPLDSDLTGG